MHATLDHVDWLSEHIATFYFQPATKLTFEPGQYVQLTVPHTRVDDRGDNRWMSLSSSPHESLIGVTTTFPERPSSFKRALNGLQHGQGVSLGTVLGDCVLPKDETVPLAFIAGGIGIAPVRSMIAWLASQGQQRNVRLLYSVTNPQELIFNEVFTSYPMQYTPIITTSNNNWTGTVGRLSSTSILTWMGNISPITLIYLSGPQGLIEPLYNDLLQAGLPRQQLVLDYFPGY